MRPTVWVSNAEIMRSKSNLVLPYKFSVDVEKSTMVLEIP